MSITVVIPTMGRDTLHRALASCADADEILVVIDRSKSDTHPDLPSNARLIEVDACDKGGHSSRNHAMPLAVSTHLAFLDDDDVFTPGAIQAMRDAACDRPVIFRMDHPQHGILPRDHQVRFGNVSTQMFLVPNDPERLGVWAPHRPELPQPGGDYTFIAGCVDKMGEPVWRDEIVARIRPDFPTVAIVTPWLNHPELAADYLTAVSVRTHRDELIVVDNGSAPAIDFATVRLERNAGFHGASNIGLHKATADIVVFLNNDVAMSWPGWLETIRDKVEPGVLVGRLRDEAWGEVDGAACPYLDGWCLAGMRDDLLELGGWDESYDEPAYYGDNDLSLRARIEGLSLRDVPIGLHHKAGVTSSDDRWRMGAAARANRERFMELGRSLIPA